MVLTNWLGGKTGLESMPTETVSTSYTEIHREVPDTHFGEVSPPPRGNYNGDVNAIHKTNYLYSSGSLKCYLNNVEVSITEVTTSHFKINVVTTGTVRVSYRPYLNSLYYGNHKAQLPNTNATVKSIPFKRQHITQIIDALGGIANQLTAERIRFSIGEFTSYAAEDTDNLRPLTPVIMPLFNQIQNQIIFLYQYAISSVDAPVTEPEYALYNYKTINGRLIEQYRQDINALESVI